MSKWQSSAHEAALKDAPVRRMSPFAHEAARDDPPVRRMGLLTHETVRAGGWSDPIYRNGGQTHGNVPEWGPGQIGGPWSQNRTGKSQCGRGLYAEKAVLSK